MVIYDTNGKIVLDVTVDDNSYRNRAIMGDNTLTLHYSLAEHAEIPVGAYCVFQGDKYTLMRPESLKMKHSRYFEYTVIMEAEGAKAKMWKFRNTVDGRLRFPLTAKPHEHLQMFVDNLNKRDRGWEIGQCIDGVETLINYDHAFCYEALGQMASEFKTEFEIDGKTVSLHKVENNKSAPLPLSYGRGNGFKPNVGRSNYGDNAPIEILYVQGGTDNIDRSKYGASELLLPKSQQLQYDGQFFEGEKGFSKEAAQTYQSDEAGLSIKRADKPLASYSEDSLDCTDIYPKRKGTVSQVIMVDKEKNFYDIVDSSIPPNLNYEECLIEGETMTIRFQSGMLAGREFDVKYIHNPKTINGVGKAGRRFEIIPQEVDGQVMPNATFAPQKDDSYAIFNCYLPDSYICDNETKTGASWDMFRAAVKYLWDNEDVKFTFTGELDGIWSKKNWENVGGRLKLGGFIRFSDERFQKEGVLVRITGIKDYINNPHSPVLTLSNSTVTSGFSTTIKELQSEDVLIEELHRSAIQFTKRRFRDAKETIGMIENALLENFTNSINPITVQTMSMLVGDESLQFRFIRSLDDSTQVPDSIQYDAVKRVLKSDVSVIQHLTLGINSISSTHTDYKTWELPAFESGILTEGDKKYYLYAKCSDSNQSGEFILSEKAIKIDGVTGFYHLLTGILNSEYNEERSFVPLYGFTEVLPGRITTDKIVSGSGESFFDMVNNSFKLGESLDFNTKGDNKLILKGTIVQSPSGTEEYIGCFRGAFDPTIIYYRGDEVTYLANGMTSSYRYISSTPKKEILPTDTQYWKLIAAGSKGEQGEAGKDGNNGLDGKDGKDGFSPAAVYRGKYQRGAEYYGTTARRDVVHYMNEYYIARTDAGRFMNFLPTDKSIWEPFGATFSSVATDLLLAQNANIAGWIFRNNRLESQDGAMWLDGKKGQIMAVGGFKGMLTAENMFMPFLRISSGDHTLKKTDHTNIILQGAIHEVHLTLPYDNSYDGMFLNIYFPPRISKMDNYGFVKGKILCLNKGTLNGDMVNEYYASQITSKYGGLAQFVNIEGEWILTNGSELLIYQKYV